MDDEAPHASGAGILAGRQPPGPPKASLRTVSIMETLSELATGQHGKPLLREDASRFHHSRPRRESEKHSNGQFSNHIMSVSERLLEEVLRDRGKGHGVMQPERIDSGKSRCMPGRRGRSVEDVLRARAPPSLPPPEVPYIGSLERRRRRKLGGKMGFFVNPRKGETDWERDDDEDELNATMFSDCEVKTNFARSSKVGVTCEWKDRNMPRQKVAKSVRNKPHERGNTPDWLKKILESASKGQLAKLQRMLATLEPTLVRTLVDHNGNNLAHLLAAHGHTAALSWLVTAMGQGFLPAILETNDKGRTPVACAIKAGNLETVRWIVENTVVRTAVAAGDLEKPLLHVAVKSNKVDILQWLLDSRVMNINTKDRRGDTSLHVAARKGFVECVTVLLGHGANAAAKNAMGLRPLDVATRMGHVAVMHMLRLHESALSLSSDLYEATVELEDMRSDHSELKNYFRDVLNVGKRLAKERDELCRELGRLHEDVSTLHEGLLLELRAFHREASVLRDHLHGNKKASDSAGQTLEETVSVVESLHGRWQAAQRGWFSGNLADMEHKLLLAEDAWKRIRLGSAGGKHGDASPEAILRCRLETVSLTTANVKMDFGQLSSSQSSLDELCTNMSKYVTDADDIPLYETTSPLSVGNKTQSRIRSLLEADRMYGSKIEHVLPQRRLTERSRRDVENVRVKDSAFEAQALPRRAQSSATLPVRVHPKKITKEEIKQKMQEIHLVSESGNASVLEIIEPSGSDPDEIEFSNMLPDSQSTPNRESGHRVIERSPFPEPDLLAGTFREAERGVDIPDGRREEYRLPPPAEFDNQPAMLKKKGFFNKFSLKWTKRREKSIDGSSEAAESELHVEEVKEVPQETRGLVAGLSQMFEELAHSPPLPQCRSHESLLLPDDSRKSNRSSLASKPENPSTEKRSSSEWEIPNVGMFPQGDSESIPQVPLGEIPPPAPPDRERERNPTPSSHQVQREKSFRDQPDPPPPPRLTSHLNKSVPDLKSVNGSHSIQIEAMSVGTSEDSGIVMRPASSASKSDTLSRPESLSGIYPPFKGVFSLAKPHLPTDHSDRSSPTPSEMSKTDPRMTGEHHRMEPRRPGRLIGRVEEAVVKNPALEEEQESPASEPKIPSKGKKPEMLQVKRIPRRMLREEKAMARKKNRHDRPWYDVSDEENDLLLTPSHLSAVPSVRSSSEDEQETI